MVPSHTDSDMADRLGLYNQVYRGSLPLLSTHWLCTLKIHHMPWTCMGWLDQLQWDGEISNSMCQCIAPLYLVGLIAVSFTEGMKQVHHNPAANVSTSEIISCETSSTCWLSGFGMTTTVYWESEGPESRGLSHLCNLESYSFLTSTSNFNVDFFVLHLLAGFQTLAFTRNQEEAQCEPS